MKVIIVTCLFIVFFILIPVGIGIQLGSKDKIDVVVIAENEDGEIDTFQIQSVPPYLVTAIVNSKEGKHKDVYLETQKDEVELNRFKEWIEDKEDYSFTWNLSVD